MQQKRLLLLDLVGGGGSRGRGGVAAASPSDNGEDRGVSLFVDHAPCVRLFHSGGDVGCRAEPKEGVAGPLLLVNSEGVLRDIEFEERAPRETDELLTHALEEIGDGFVAVLPEAFFNRTTLARLSDTGLLGGVLVLEEDRDSGDGDGDGGGGGSGSTLAGVAVVGGEGGAVGSSNPDVSTPQVGRMLLIFNTCGITVFVSGRVFFFLHISGDSTPTAVFDVDASYPWNPRGDGLMMESLDFPVALVVGGSVDRVRARAVSNGNVGSEGWRYPLHKARMAFYFGGSGMDLNSQACLEWTDINGDRDPQCKPLGGQSAWASVGEAGLGDRETVFAVAGMDSTSMFHDRAPGANSAVSGLVALLSAAECLGAVGREGGVHLSDLPRQIVFAAFQAESYGFTGSRRFVQDWRDGVDCQNVLGPSQSPSGGEACLDPLYPSLEFRKLGRPAHVVSVDQVGCLPESKLWIHSSPKASASDQGMLSRLSPGGDGGVTLENATRPELPPSPLTAFVKADSAQSGFVIAGYDEDFSCPHYHDHRDTRTMVNASSVAAAAEVLAKSVFLLAGGGEAATETIAVNATLVETLLNCLLEDWTCSTVMDYVKGDLANMEEILGFRVSVDVPFPPTLYAGPLEFRNGGGLPTVRHTNDDGSWRLHPSWSQEFDPDHNKIQLVPSVVEMFSRAFLSEQAGLAHAGSFGRLECKSSGDCPAGACEDAEGRKFGPETDSGTNSETDSGPRLECVRGRCGCQSGFHHIALGVGLERDETIDQYTVQDGAVERGAPLWTEVTWGSIGVEVYLDPGNAVGKVAVGVGAAVTAAAGVVSWWVFRSLSKRKLL
eukprot:jgi/Undpi1/9270/HiC_scaffold_26.g11728.m1